MSKSGRIRHHPLVDALIGDPKRLPTLTVMTGFVGRGVKAKTVRIYKSLTFSSYIEVPAGDVKHVEPGATRLEPNTIWLDAGARIVLGPKSELKGDQPETLLAGDIMRRYWALGAAASEQGGIAPLPPPTAPIICDPTDYPGCPPPPPPVWHSLGLNMQHQQQTEWCWSATTVSITLFYDASSSWTQCSLVDNQTGQSGWPQQPPAGTTCCNISAANKNQTACNQAWYPDLALAATGHFAKTDGAATIEDVAAEIGNRRPLSLNIQWTGGGGGHNPAIDGYKFAGTSGGHNLISVQDPWYGPSVQHFDTFPGSYQGGATWQATYYTQ